MKVEDILKKKVVKGEDGIERLVENKELLNPNKDKKSFGNKLGWYPLPVDILPTKGMFYPEGTKIQIKSASVDEIKHWSTININDFMDINDNLNFILERCMEMRDEEDIPQTWNNLTEIDRLYVVFKISELTFPEKENKLVINAVCDEQLNKKEIYVESNMLKLFDMEKELYKIYSPSDRCLVKKTKTGELIKFFIPTVGVATAVKKYAMDKRRNGEFIDQFVLKVMPYLVKEPMHINDTYIFNLMNDISMWSRNKVLYVSGIIDLIEKSLKMLIEYKCDKNSATKEVSLFFRGEPNIKNLFYVSTELDELV